uniref:Uncharacterized protein n=1 Tax=Rhinopithecus bieti TaxID=61621 RepID=A0A2K6L3N0_RHIBE
DASLSCSRSLRLPPCHLPSVIADSFFASHLSRSPEPEATGGPPGEANPAPSPRSHCASPTTSWKRRGPREGASPTSLLSSTPCWTGLRGPTPPGTPGAEDAPGLHALRQALGEGGLGLGPLGLQAWLPLGPRVWVEGPRVSQVSCQLQ